MAVGEQAIPDYQHIAGVKIAVLEAGIKYPNRKDLVLFEIAANATIAGVFTQNAFCAAPVTICKDNLAISASSSDKRYFVINTGNANAGTGDLGMQHARDYCAELAKCADIDANNVYPFSTGVIGEYLPIETLTNAMPKALSKAGESSWVDAAEGIMTTDTRPKGLSKSVEFGGKLIQINGISKGAGMIKPNMATMLGFVATDAKIEQSLLQELLSDIAEASFNRITIDGDTSTNDCCMLVATAQSDADRVESNHPDFDQFKSTLKEVFLELAHAIVKDGEGATKFVSVKVEDAASNQEALDVAYTIAHSPLVKTALFASDPNWGRILAALGRSPIQNFDLSKVDIYLDDVCIVESGGKCAAYTEEAGQAVMDLEQLTIRVVLKRGEIQETVWTTDLSHDYVTINAEYRT